MRGAQQFSILPANRAGIIPADAGSTLRWTRVRPRSWDHPRGCGEHAWYWSARIAINGSSPRMRGALERIASMAAVRGIIPADAGSTVLAASCTRWTEDHPRGCGEHITRQYSTSPRLGSSPRMRGAHRTGAKTRITIGIIPADAGSTWLSDAAKSVGEDHPRGCGEHS